MSVSLAGSAAKLSPFGRKLQRTQYSPVPPPPKAWHRKWLRKYSNGYQIFGNWFNFSGLTMCLGETASLIITWPCDRPKVADIFLLKKERKEKNNFYQLAQWCKCKIMLWDDCKHADFQMFDKTVQKYQKGRLTVSVTNTAGLLAFWAFYTNDWGEKRTEGLSITCQILTHQLWVKRTLSLKTQKVFQICYYYCVQK